MVTEVLATPLVKVMAVEEPKDIAELTLLTTVGAVTGFVLEFAPEKVKLLAPVYPVAVFPLPSFAVIVRFCVLPAVWDPLPVITNFVAAAGASTTKLILPVVKEPVPDKISGTETVNT